MGLETGMDVSALDVSAQSAAILTDRWSDRVALVEVLNEDTVSHTVTMAGFGVNGVKITDASYTPQTMVLFPDCRAVFEVDPSSVVSDTAFSSLGISGDSIAAFSFDCTVDEDKTTNGTLSFSAALCWAVYSVILQEIGHRYNMIFLTRKIFFYGLLTILPFFLVNPWSVSWQQFSPPAVWFNLLFLGVFASLLCFYVWNVVLRRLGAVSSSN